MAKRDYYEVLGVPKDSTQEDIKKAYRKLAMEHHPDKGGSDETFKELNEAYETLGDSDKKAKYDSPSQANEHNPWNSPFGPMFTQQRPQTRGNNINLTIKLTLEEIFTGAVKKFTYNRNTECVDCRGTGGKEIQDCIDCNGSGVKVSYIDLGHARLQTGYTCERCNGSGINIKTPCNTCSSKGVIGKTETTEITIPAGVSDAMKYMMSSLGEAIQNGATGDLVISFAQIPHKTFVRDNNNIYQTLKISYSELVLGSSLELMTIDGSNIKFKTPPFSKVGDNLRLTKKGMQAYQSEGRGDMIIVIDIVIPTSITEREKELLTELASLEPK